MYFDNDSKKKLLFVASSLDGGGAERVVVNLITHLDRNKYDVLLVLFEDILAFKEDYSLNTNKELFFRVLGNIVNNAIRFTPVGGKIIIKMQEIKDNFLKVSVTNNGSYIPENLREKIFDKFFRITEKNLAYKAKGSGLGLAIVKHVIEAHDGQITVKSNKNEGSSFRLIFPL